jgi:hypothetical protein
MAKDKVLSTCCIKEAIYLFTHDVREISYYHLDIKKSHTNIWPKLLWIVILFAAEWKQ